ncbi:THO complex subunit 6-like [Arapaima gigas]
MGPIELLHMSVFSQSFSPCGRFLAASNNYGEIAIFSLSSSLSPEATGVNQKPILTFTAHEGPIFALLSTDTHLLSAGNGEISAWSWGELAKQVREQSRDNSLAVGGGDNNIHVMDLETGVFKSVLQGHTDYIHCLSMREREGELLSGGEDGAVRIWGERLDYCWNAVIECGRPQYGKWISCLTTDSDWMLCGGGPSLSLWHLRSLSPTSIFPLSGCQRQAMFYQDLILAVGEGHFLSHCLLGGEVKSLIPCSPPSLNTLALNTNSTEHRVLTVGGSSDQIDVFTNLSYKAFSLSF